MKLYDKYSDLAQSAKKTLQDKHKKFIIVKRFNRRAHAMNDTSQDRWICRSTSPLQGRGPIDMVQKYLQDYGED